MSISNLLLSKIQNQLQNKFDLGEDVEVISSSSCPLVKQGHYDQDKNADCSYFTVLGSKTNGKFITVWGVCSENKIETVHSGPQQNTYNHEAINEKLIRKNNYKQNPLLFQLFQTALNQGNSKSIQIHQCKDGNCTIMTKNANFSPILIIGFEECPWCVKVFDELSIHMKHNPITKIDINRTKFTQILQDLKRNGLIPKDWNTVPLVFINSQFIGGYDDTAKYLKHENQHKKMIKNIIKQSRKISGISSGEDFTTPEEIEKEAKRLDNLTPKQLEAEGIKTRQKTFFTPSEIDENIKTQFDDIITTRHPTKDQFEEYKKAIDQEPDTNKQKQYMINKQLYNQNFSDQKRGLMSFKKGFKNGFVYLKDENSEKYTPQKETIDKEWCKDYLHNKETREYWWQYTCGNSPTHPKQTGQTGHKLTPLNLTHLAQYIHCL